MWQWRSEGPDRGPGRCLNAVLPAAYQLQEKALEIGKNGRTWGPLPYAALHDKKVLDDFCGVLDVAQKAAIAGTPLEK
jgi:hypothetical protein